MSSKAMTNMLIRRHMSGQWTNALFPQTMSKPWVSIAMVTVAQNNGNESRNSW